MRLCVQLSYYRQLSDTFIVKELAETREEVVLLLNPPEKHQGWVDANDPDDPYPYCLWAHFMHFVQGPHFADSYKQLQIGGGRY